MNDGQVCAFAWCKPWEEGTYVLKWRFVPPIRRTHGEAPLELSP